MAIVIKDFIQLLDKKQEEGFKALQETSVKDEKFGMILQNTMNCVNIENSILERQQQVVLQAAQAAKAKDQEEAEKKNPKAKIVPVDVNQKKED